MSRCYTTYVEPQSLEGVDVVNLNIYVQSYIWNLSDIPKKHNRGRALLHATTGIPSNVAMISFDLLSSLLLLSLLIFFFSLSSLVISHLNNQRYQEGVVLVGDM